VKPLEWMIIMDDEWMMKLSRRSYAQESGVKLAYQLFRKWKNCTALSMNKGYKSRQ